MKKTLLFLAAIFMMASTAKAKTTETTLWEDTYTSSGVGLNSETVATFKAGDILRVYATVPEGGANFKIVYKGDPDWNETTIPSINTQWPYVNSDPGYYEFTLTDADITALSGMHIYIYKGDNSTIDKVSIIKEVTPTGETELLSENWTASWTPKTFAAQSGAKIGDVIRFTYEAPGSYSYFQFNILDAYGNKDSFTNTETNVGTSIETAATLSFDFEITNVSDMEKIQNEGFGIKGNNFTLTSVKLLTYSDSYDAVSMTIGTDGVATWSCGSKNVQISSCAEVRAYYASSVSTGQVSLTELTGCIPASTGVIIRGTAGTYTVPVGSENYPSSFTNYLKATGDYAANVAASTDGTYHYIFAKHNSETAFFKLEAVHNLAAHKAYLETTEDITPSDPAGTRGLELDFGDGTTAILPIENDGSSKLNLNEDGVYYTLQGTRVQSPTKGLYILNGKKVLVK